jgi:hypothetical protein
VRSVNKIKIFFVSKKFCVNIGMILNRYRAIAESLEESNRRLFYLMFYQLRRICLLVIYVNCLPVTELWKLYLHFLQMKLQVLSDEVAVKASSTNIT